MIDSKELLRNQGLLNYMGQIDINMHLYKIYACIDLVSV